MYCITLNDGHYDKIKTLGYIPVGLGKDITTKGFLTDNTGKNITTKNPYYGEYTLSIIVLKIMFYMFDIFYIDCDGKTKISFLYNMV